MAPSNHNNKQDGAVQLKISGYDVHFPFKPYASQLVRPSSRATHVLHGIYYL